MILALFLCRRPAVYAIPRSLASWVARWWMPSFLRIFTISNESLKSEVHSSDFGDRVRPNLLQVAEYILAILRILFLNFSLLLLEHVIGMSSTYVLIVRPWLW